MSDLVDVVAVEIKEPYNRRLIERGLTPAQAEDYIKIAVWRRGVGHEFYTTQPALSPTDGKNNRR